MAAAGVIAAAAEQRDLRWYRNGKVARKPKLEDPLQLFSLVEAVETLASGRVKCKVEDSYYDKPVDFLPQGGGVDVGEVLELTRSEVLPANPKLQDMVMDLSELNNLHEAALLHTV